MMKLNLKIDLNPTSLASVVKGRWRENAEELFQTNYKWKVKAIHLKSSEVRFHLIFLPAPTPNDSQAAFCFRIVQLGEKLFKQV
jgi:hypothetical protein